MNYNTLALAVLLALSAPFAAAQGVVERASTKSDGSQSAGPCGTGIGSTVALDESGRLVVFEAAASDLVPGDGNGVNDVFVKDRLTGAVERVSVSTGGAQADADCQDVEITPDGRYVCFWSAAANLVSGDTNGVRDVFLRDRQTGVTERVSLSDLGAQGDKSSESGFLSADGRYVAFWSSATNLVPGDTNGEGDIYVRDRLLARTLRVSLMPGAGQGNGNSISPSMSADGRYVAFATLSSNWVAGDANGTWDVFVRDTQTATLLRVGPALGTWNGASTQPWISGDGEFVAFLSAATNVVVPDANGSAVDVYVWRKGNASVQRASVSSTLVQADAASDRPRLSQDGRLVAFESLATNLVAGDTNAKLDVFLRDLAAGVTSRISIGHQGAQGGSISYQSALSDDGLRVGFGSQSTNLVPGDTNFQSDVFVHDRGYTQWTTYCTAKTNSLGCTSSIAASGIPSASDQTDFALQASLLRNNTVGILLYSKVGPAAIPLQGGFLCVASPFVRTPGAGTGGTPPPLENCSGTLVFDLNAWMAGGNDAALVPGQSVWGQFWSRDTGFAPPDNSNLTNGLELTVGP